MRIADTETNYMRNSLADMNEFKGKEKIKFHFARGEPKDDFLLLFFPLFFFFFYQSIRCNFCIQMEYVQCSYLLAARLAPLAGGESKK